ncbi:unnamed protein product [Nyctereutes procyonoides]|uniref:(raccoon dog) hypothetical protein n=1 Tax=Nyctereutes procyonoides TaxID=34880 RepID=A0A811Z6A0_NYCPR|nr:unnamed protein product [Nyctereutes procyonoides]
MLSQERRVRCTPAVKTQQVGRADPRPEGPGVWPLTSGGVLAAPYRWTSVGASLSPASRHACAHSCRVAWGSSAVPSRTACHTRSKQIRNFLLCFYCRICTSNGIWFGSAFSPLSRLAAHERVVGPRVGYSQPSQPLEMLIRNQKPHYRLFLLLRLTITKLMGARAGWFVELRRACRSRNAGGLSGAPGWKLGAPGTLPHPTPQKRCRWRGNLPCILRGWHPQASESQSGWG